MTLSTPLLVVLLAALTRYGTSWLTKEVATWAIEDFEQHEKNRSLIQFRGTDRRVSWPFISGDGFRHICNHICEDANRCRMDPAAVKDGECIFVKTDFFEFFAKDVINRIPSTSRFIIISHNGDLSAPDGQNDAPRIGMPKYVTSDILANEYEKGRLIAHHGQNLWWVNKTTPRPAFAHCLPIGFENRQYPIGRQVHIYTTALKRFVIDRPVQSIAEQSKKPLLLVAFYPKSRVPDRSLVLSILRVFPPKGVPKDPNPFYNYTDLNHMEWLQAIGEHRFVLAPFGHGLDTHRISEILMMGGIPVMRRSTISSCYDDSDNSYVADGHRGNHTSAGAGANKSVVKTRGSLPVVIVDRWEDVTKERLEQEWERLSKIPDTHWDWRRLFIYHWIDRILAR